MSGKSITLYAKKLISGGTHKTEEYPEELAD